MATARIHPTALVETEDIGEGTSVWAFVHIMPGARVGANCNVGDYVFIESGAVVGNYVTVKNGCQIWDGVAIEDGVFVGPGVIFTNDLYPRSPRLAPAQRRYQDRNWLLPTHIRRGATLGAGCVLLPGITIGEFAMIAAGAVVTHDVPAHALVLGSPAAQVGWVCECGQRLALVPGTHDRFQCPTCSPRYLLAAGTLSKTEQD
jgi:acetyltransferase-like isoleucine patch superfamily enzyme